MSGHFIAGFAHLDAFLVAAGVERAFDLQTGLVVVAPINDQLDRGEAIRQRQAAPA